MNRLRGSVDRDRARRIGELLDAQGIEAYQRFWKGYRDAARELGLMIRTNGLPLALALAIDRAKIGGDHFPSPEAGDETRGRARAVVDLAKCVRPDKPPARPDDLLDLVRHLTTVGRAAYNDAIDTALATLVWQKSLSAARVRREDDVAARAATEPSS